MAERGSLIVPDADGELLRLGLAAMRRRQQRSLAIQDGEERTKRVKWALSGESRRRIDNMLALSKNMPPINDTGDRWDQNPWPLGVENGVVDLRTGKLRPGRPSGRITMSVRASYDRAATCPLWEKTISAIFNEDPDMIA
jgi:putative DNA primase/helicase